jgi:hypothetical protein
MAELLQLNFRMGDIKLTPAQTKMATLPFGAKLWYLLEILNDCPLLQCWNIFVLPRVPVFFSEKIKNVAAYL